MRSRPPQESKLKNSIKEINQKVNKNRFVFRSVKREQINKLVFRFVCVSVAFVDQILSLDYAVIRNVRHVLNQTGRAAGSSFLQFGALVPALGLRTPDFDRVQSNNSVPSANHINFIL